MRIGVPVGTVTGIPLLRIWCFLAMGIHQLNFIIELATTSLESQLGREEVAMASEWKPKINPPYELDRELVRLGDVYLSVREAHKQGFIESYVVDRETGKVAKYVFTPKGMLLVERRTGDNKV